jgi:endonuclease/exonuclease/phosphatase (EEP) superfamily protein YafD
MIRPQTGPDSLRSSNFAILLILGALGVATACALLAPLGWPFELFSHFRAQYAATSLLVALLLVWRERRALAAVAVFLALWHSVPGVQRALAGPAAASCDGPAISAATVNLQFTNHDPQRFLDWVGEHPVDLLILQEVTEDWAAALERLDAYPYRQLLTREDAYGIGVLSRLPLEEVSPVDLAGDGLPSLDGVLSLPGQELRFLALHTRWPILPRLARSRDVVLGRTADRVRGSALPAIVLGDLNLTPDAPAFDRLLDESGLRDVMDGRRWRPTWLAGFWPLALRIDHILVSPGLCVEHAEVGPSIGSDHRPVLARLRVRLPASAAFPVATATERR